MIKHYFKNSFTFTYLSKLTDTLNLMGGSGAPHGNVAGGDVLGAVTTPLKWKPIKKIPR